MEDLRTGKCDLALVGGVHATTPPPVLYAFCQLGALSRTGQSVPSTRTRMALSSRRGWASSVLKRREDAERDGDRIYAVLKGQASASDGRALGLLAPRLEGEVLQRYVGLRGHGLSPRHGRADRGPWHRGRGR